ncbi:sugar 3,4-ketoisomerase [Prosthecobacter fluviatilis]|uniref:FdtA/QdtA family cupin domain-containing protein n=1 Tax=Prosthecobacter fluviatilis TaxID=445931 RepID=A0ABW0KL80_9BACT
MIQETTIETCSVRGVRLYEMRHVVDPVRGNLTALELSQELPFAAQRIFLTYDIPSESTRGEHAHRLCEQFLVCVHGECHLRVDDGENSEEFCLNRPTFGVLVPPMVWAQEHLHSADSVLMVLASRPYEAEDYIRDYSEFTAMVKGWKKRT